MLTAMAAEIGLTDIRSGSVGDDREDIQGALERALLADMVVLTGGVSMGKYDFVPEVLKDLGMKTVFHQVAQKPGKPLLFAKRDTTLLFGLPGNPLSSHLCFHRYVAPAARAMGGLPLRRQQFFGRLDENVPGAGRRSFFQLVEVSGPHDEKASDLIPLIGKGSADIYAPVAADAYIIVPAGEKGLSAGSMVQFEYIGNGPWTS
jgi:molybdopterin molybdotransferase